MLISQHSQVILSGHDHIIRIILTHVGRADLISCLTVSPQFHDVASEIIYRSINLIDDGAGKGNPINKVFLGWDACAAQSSTSGAPGTLTATKFKARQLALVRHITLGVHPSDICATLNAAGQLLTNLETLTIIPEPHELVDSAPMMCKNAEYQDDVLAHRRRPCPFITALNPRRVVFCNLGFSGLPIPHYSGWHPAKLESVAYYLPLDRRNFGTVDDIVRSPLVEDTKASFPGKELEVKIVFAKNLRLLEGDELEVDLEQYLSVRRDEFGAENAFYDLPPGWLTDWREPIEKKELVDYMRGIVTGILPGCRSLLVVGVEWIPIGRVEWPALCIDDDAQWAEVRTEIIKDLEEDVHGKLCFVSMEDYVGSAPQWEMTEHEKVEFDWMLESERKGGSGSFAQMKAMRRAHYQTHPA